MEFTITRRNTLTRDSALKAGLQYDPAATELGSTAKVSPFQSFSFSSDFLSHRRAIEFQSYLDQIATRQDSELANHQQQEITD